jgi:hypothetical protein
MSSLLPFTTYDIIFFDLITREKGRKIQKLNDLPFIWQRRKTELLKENSFSRLLDFNIEY